MKKNEWLIFGEGIGENYTGDRECRIPSVGNLITK